MGYMGNSHLGFTPQAQNHTETCYWATFWFIHIVSLASLVYGTAALVNNKISPYGVKLVLT